MQTQNENTKENGQVKQEQPNTTEENQNQNQNQTNQTSTTTDNTNLNQQQEEQSQQEGKDQQQQQEQEQEPELVNFKLTYGKNTHDITFDYNAPLKRLKDHIQELTGVPSKMQKLMYKGMLKDDESPLNQTTLKEGSKVLLMGSTTLDVIQVNVIPQSPSSSSSGLAIDRPKKLCELPEHQKVINKGRPEDGIIGKKGIKSTIQNGFSLHGMLNQAFGKVRLTFKTDEEQLWIATSERTQKLPFSSIHVVSSEPITGQEEYHIMYFQLGPTEKSRYYVYFVPCQYVEAIKDTILGKFQFF